MLRTNVVLFCLIWLLCLIAVAFATIPVVASEYRAIEPKQCHATVQQWIDREADGGKKIVGVEGWAGAYIGYRIRWDNGDVQSITTGPALGPDGQPAICILAVQDVPDTAR